jgi:nucleoside-diphosphate-sugar epimerase
MNLNNVLLTGASGKLGSVISKLSAFNNLWTPGVEVFDITSMNSMERFFDAHEIDAVIHCAALARMVLCENDPLTAINANIIGTSNLVKAVIKKEKMLKKPIRFVHISTDAVYDCSKGSYSEKDPCIPYNKYGWTKLGAECVVNLLSNFCIIRTRFFDPDNIPFDESATDLYTSTMPINDLAFSIIDILKTKFVGTINVGKPSQSDFDNYKQYKSSLQTCKYDEITKNLTFPIAKDASLDLKRWNRMKSQFNNI